MVENTQENRIRLAQRIVDGLDLNDLIQIVTDQLIEAYDRDDHVFNEAWESTIGE